MLNSLSNISIFDYIGIIAFIVLSIGAFTRYGVTVMTICGPILLLWMSIFLVSLVWHILWPFIWMGMYIVFWLSILVLCVATFRYWCVVLLWFALAICVIMLLVSAVFMWPIIFIAIFIVVI